MNDLASAAAPPAPRPSAPPGAMPVRSRTVTLNTDFTQRVFRRCFDRLKADLYVLTVRTRSSGMDEAAKVIETVISEAFASARQDLEAELERSDVLLDSVQLSELSEYERKLTTTVTYSTPRAKEYLDLLLKLDQLLMRYDVLWLEGYIETQPRVARSQNWQRRMIKIANRLRELGNRTRAGITREQEKRNGAPQGANAPAAEHDSTTTAAGEAAGDAEDLDAEAGAPAEELPDEFRDPADLLPANAQEEGETDNPASSEAPVPASESDGDPKSEASSAPRTRRRRVADAASADAASG